MAPFRRSRFLLHFRTKFGIKQLSNSLNESPAPALTVPLWFSVSMPFSSIAECDFFEDFFEASPIVPAPKSAAKQELSRWKDGEKGREKRGEGRLAVCPSWDLAARAGRSRFQVKFWPRYTGGGLAMRHLVAKILETLISTHFNHICTNY